MFAVDNSTAVAVMPTPSPEGTPGYFSDGDPGTGEAATIVTSDWLNGVQGELLAVIEAGGLTPDKSDNTQLLAAIMALMASASAPTGVVQYRAGASAAPGWLIANGSTIGDTSSGANYANAAAQALFTLLWTDFDDATLPVKTSAGGVSVRGANAAADWAAHKRMTLPDLRGQFIRGVDASRGVDPARVLGSTQLDALQGFHVKTSLNINFGGSGIPALEDGSGTTPQDYESGGPVDDGTHGVPRVASETRPTNVALLPMIKL